MSKKEKIVYTVLGIFLALLLIFNSLWLGLIVSLLQNWFRDPYADYPALATQRGTAYIAADDTAYIRTDRVYLDPEKVGSGEIKLYQIGEIIEERERIFAEKKSNPDSASE